MSEASGDPLYRSDTRTAPTGSQQADLAPVNDQPDEHWEQQAEARSSEGSAPIDPMGAQPPPEFDTSTDEDGAQTSPVRPNEAVVPTSAPSQPAPATAKEAPPQSDESHNENHAGAATFDHGAHIPIGGELAWSDPQGDHVRSAEISVDASQTTTVGSALTMANEGDAVAQGALVQAVSAANGAIGLVQANFASGPLTQVTDLASSLQQSGTSALQQVFGALGDVQGSVGSLTDTVATTASDAGALLSDTLDGVTSLATDALGTGGVNDLMSEGLLSALDDPLEDVALPGGLTAPTETAAPTGLLASLFTPQDGDTPTDSLLDTGLTDTLGGFDAGGLLGGPDDHPHLDLPGL